MAEALLNPAARPFAAAKLNDVSSSFKGRNRGGKKHKKGRESWRTVEMTPEVYERPSPAPPAQEWSIALRRPEGNEDPEMGAKCSEKQDRGFDPTEPMVTIKLDASPSHAYVHRSVLCLSSEFFKSKQKPEWSEALEPAVVDLKCEDSSTFRIYVNWLYTSKLPVAYTEFEGGSANADELSHIWVELASAYTLGEVLIDFAFQNCVIEAMHAGFATEHGGKSFFKAATEVISTIYGGSCSKDKARRFLVDRFVHHASIDDMATESDALPPAFLLDLATAMVSQRPATSHDAYQTIAAQYKRHLSGRVVLTD